MSLLRSSSQRIPLRRFITQQIRFNSTSTTSSINATKADSSHILAGLGGGAVVLTGIYGYYHYSGAAKLVSTAQSTIDAAQSTKDKLLASAPSTKDALALLRTAAHTYAGTTIPGSKQLVDKTFDQLDELSEKYGDKLSHVLKESYEELKEASSGDNLKDGGEKLVKAGLKLMEKVRATVEEKGGEVLDQLLKDHPELEKSLGGSLKEFRSLTDKYGPEAQSIVTSTTTSLSKILTSSSSGLNAKTISSLQSLLNEKTQELKELASKSSSEAWEKAAKEAGPLLEKVPDLKQLVDEKLGGLGDWVGEEKVEVIKSLYSKLSDLSKSGKSTEELTKEAKKIVEKEFGSLDDLKEKATSFASAGAGGNYTKYLESVPGLAGLGKMLNDSDLKHLRELAEKHGHEGEKVLESTYDEIKQILKKKLDEAKRVLGDAKTDVKGDGKKSDSKKSDSKKDEKKSEKKDGKDEKSDRTKVDTKAVSSSTPSKKTLVDQADNRKSGTKVGDKEEKSKK